jgi:7,8-dihydroneopterin aldolase/epimerase/oxygenase
MLIALEGMKFYAHHGHYDEERKKGNDFIVDAYVSTPLNENLNDELTQTLNYEILYDCVKNEMEKPSKLLETVAVNIINELQNKFPSAISLRVRVSKLTPPLPGDVQRAFVELERKLK